MTFFSTRESCVWITYRMWRKKNSFIKKVWEFFSFFSRPFLFKEYFCRYSFYNNEMCQSRNYRNRIDTLFILKWPLERVLNRIEINTLNSTRLRKSFHSFHYLYHTHRYVFLSIPNILKTLTFEKGVTWTMAHQIYKKKKKSILYSSNKNRL